MTTVLLKTKKKEVDEKLVSIYFFKLFILWIVECVVWHSNVVVLLITMFVKVVATCPCENEESEEA